MIYYGKLSFIKTKKSSVLKICEVKIMTNYERIKQMSVEEMATFLQEVEYRRAFDGSGAKWESKGTVINWLESEVEDNAL